MANGVVKSDDKVDRFSLYILRNLLMATKNERTLAGDRLKHPSDCLGYRATVKSIERVADHATRIAIKSMNNPDPVPVWIMERLEKLSNSSLLF